MYKEFCNGNFGIMFDGKVSQVKTGTDTTMFYVPTVESKVNGKFADRFGKKEVYNKKNTVFMNLRFDKYNSMNFKLGLADDGDTVVVKHRKKGAIKSMKWNTKDVAAKIADRVETNVKFEDGRELNIKYSTEDIENKIKTNPNIFRTCVNVGAWCDGSRHDHGCGFNINRRQLGDF